MKANPGQITVVRARFSLPSAALTGAGRLIKPRKYVHHCHIVEHEDNDMMERMIVVPERGIRALQPPTRSILTRV